MSESQLDQLARSIQDNHRLDIDDRQLTALLGWLTRSARNLDGRRLSRILGEPGDQPQLMDRALSLLDDALFDGERLKEVKAGVGPDQTNAFRHRRFRLLMGAFHPDRYPEHAERLTNRSQIITHGYAGFKAQLTTGDLDENWVRPKVPSTTRPRSYKGITPSWHVARNIWDRWGQDRFLAHKIIGILILAMALPLVSVLLENEWHRALPDSALDSQKSAEIRSRQSSEVDVLPKSEPATPKSLADAPSESEDSLPSEALRPDGADLLEPRQSAAAESVQLFKDSDHLETPVEINTEKSQIEVMAAAMSDPEGRRDDGVIAVRSIIAASTEPAEEKPASDPSVSKDSLAPEARSPDGAGLLESKQSGVEASAQLNNDAEPPETPGETTTGESQIAELAAPISAPEDRSQDSLIAAQPIVLASTDRAEESPVADSGQPEQSVGLYLTPGSLTLGPLHNHQVGTLLKDYQLGIEHGNLEGILNVLGSSPWENSHEGREWFEQRYGELFEQTLQRSLSLRVIGARRDGEGWLIDADYWLEMVEVEGGEVLRVERVVRFVILPDVLGLRIVGVEY